MELIGKHKKLSISAARDGRFRWPIVQYRQDAVSQSTRVPQPAENSPLVEKYMAPRKRRTFNPGLKLEIMRRIKEQGQIIPNASKSIDNGQAPIWRW
jgi:hypothetical protein